MPTKRSRRVRAQQPEVTAYQRFELLTGEVVLPVAGYTGYHVSGEPVIANCDLERMESDWDYHRDELLAYWIGTRKGPWQDQKPWCFVVVPRPGTRPWAWWRWDSPASMKARESEFEYLQRHNLLLPGEPHENIADFRMS